MVNIIRVDFLPNRNIVMIENRKMFVNDDLIGVMLK